MFPNNFPGLSPKGKIDFASDLVPNIGPSHYGSLKWPQLFERVESLVIKVSR